MTVSTAEAIPQSINSEAQDFPITSKESNMADQIMRELQGRLANILGRDSSPCLEICFLEFAVQRIIDEFEPKGTRRGFLF